MNDYLYLLGWHLPNIQKICLIGRIQINDSLIRYKGGHFVFGKFTNNLKPPPVIKLLYFRIKP